MNRRKLVPITMLALFLLGSVPATSFAASDESASSGPKVKQGYAAPSSGSPGEYGGPGRHGRGPEHMLKTLGITDEQKTKIRDLRVGFSDRTRKNRTSLMSAKDEKRSMLASGKIDQQKLAQLDEQIVKLLGDVLKEKLKLRRDRLALLTPEQIGRIADWKAHGKSRSHMRRGRWGSGKSGFSTRDLGLSDDQNTKMRAMTAGFLASTRKTRTDLFAVRDEKKTMLISGKIDQQKLAQLDEQIVGLVTGMIREKFKVKRDRLALLTPDQLEKLADRKAKKMSGSRLKRPHRGLIEG